MPETVEQIREEIKALNSDYAKTKNAVEKAVISDKIKELEAKIVEIELSKNKKGSEAILQKDNPVRADHKEVKRTSGFMTGREGSFIGII